MARASESDPTRVTLIAAVLALLADQVTKAAAVTVLEQSPHRLGPLTLTVVRNTGGPFGVFPGSSALWTGLTAALLVTAVVLIGRRADSVLVAAVAGLVVGGGAGNLVDRLVRAPGPGRGGVVDWIRIDPYPKVFNLADVAIRVGALVLLVTVLLATAASRSHEPLHPGE